MSGESLFWAQTQRTLVSCKSSARWSLARWEVLRPKNGGFFAAKQASRQIPTSDFAFSDRSRYSRIYPTSTVSGQDFSAGSIPWREFTSVFGKSTKTIDLIAA